jgi:cysteine-rich repeat protein
MQVRRLLLLAPLALLGCQTGFEECKKYNWFVCAYNDATGGETEGETDSDPTTTQSTVSPAVCGDMVVEGDEVCDDGTMNTMDQWKVAKTCKAGCIEYADFCGDMAINGSEICDDPGGKNTPNPWEPTATCKDDCSDFSQYCGDGIINGPENCDSGVDNSDAYTGKPHCNAACEKDVPYCGDGDCQAQEDIMDCPDDCSPMCGDGKVQAGEVCDDGMDTADCNGDCSKPSCGDGYLNMAAGEECDDGNNDDTDACRNDCTNALCGDGVVQAEVEECDDGNQKDDDNCSNDCIAARRMFVTAQEYKAGAIGGVLNADMLCQSAAAAVPVPVGPGNTWMAWLSDAMLSSPLSRVSAADKNFTGWYLLPTDTPVAKGWSGLTSGTLVNSINVTETAVTLMDGSGAWTNTKADGTNFGTNDCVNWTSSAVALSSGWGNIAETLVAWTQAGTTSCSSSLRLYCLEVSP